MKIIVHMGQSKTGTSSLQESLHAAPEMLRARKVLYPRFGHKYVAHHLLLALCGSANRLPPWNLDRLGGPEGAEAAARSAWQMTCEDIRRNPPELLVLSSEYFINHLDSGGKARLAALLSRLSSDITPVLYVRHPVDHYRARLQQALKHGDRRCVPVSGNLKGAILDTEAAFGRKPELVAFDRRTLHGRDIVCDFATRFLAPWIQATDLPSLNTNVGLSAEALVLMAQLRAEAGGTYEASRQVSNLIPKLEALDRSDPPAQSLTLLPEVAEAALRSATNHLWLARTGQLQIPGLDLDRIDGASPPEWMATVPSQNLFHHDPERLNRLRISIEQLRARASSANRSGKPSENPILRIRDLLLRFLLRKLASSQDRTTGAVPTRENPVRRSSQGDRNENHSTDGNFDTGAGDRP
ncbi:hypothetical protein [Tabrizicola sp.]|uniref:hypothetical protein n=1 Tax=Tabrizicola sp. TaxID=2005166 RepID=UPI002619C919|nr:hypothetical protein [Tabrizicola sp.]MDM7932498.1 hypothetical protein [Tabrizicola sp.]